MQEVTIGENSSVNRMVGGREGGSDWMHGVNCHVGLTLVKNWYVLPSHPSNEYKIVEGGKDVGVCSGNGSGDSGDNI